MEKKYKMQNMENATEIFIYNNMIYIYSCLTATLIILTVWFSFFYFKTCEKSSKNLHQRTVESIVCAEMDFFKKNESGELFNRFSKDLGAVDELFPRAFALTLQVINH